MALEIERKFLVTDDAWRGLGTATPFRQGYLVADKGRSVRVRLAGDTAFLTVKGPSSGRGRLEYEYEVPVGDADALLDSLCLRPIIEKTRTRIDLDGVVWEVDEFAGDNAGLIVAEVELDWEGQSVPIPAWVGEEVTDDPRYLNANLVSHPFKDW